MRHLHALLVALATLVATASPVSATHTIDVSASVGGSCTLNLCQVGGWHRVTSKPFTDCSGSPGSYLKCFVHHTCEGSGSGTAATFTLSCTGGPTTSCSTLLTGSCSMKSSGVVAIPVNACAYLTIAVTGVAGTSGSASHSFQICVDPWGPTA